MLARRTELSSSRNSVIKNRQRLTTKKNHSDFDLNLTYPKIDQHLSDNFVPPTHNISNATRNGIFDFVYDIFSVYSLCIFQ